MNKPIEEIKISKKDYTRAIDNPLEATSAEALIREQEAWENKKGQKRRKKAPINDKDDKCPRAVKFADLIPKFAIRRQATCDELRKSE